MSIKVVKEGPPIQTHDRNCRGVWSGKGGVKEGPESVGARSGRNILGPSSKTGRNLEGSCVLTLANKTSAVRHWLPKEGRECTIQKLWSFGGSVHWFHKPLKKKVNFREDGKFKISLRGHCVALSTA